MQGHEPRPPAYRAPSAGAARRRRAPVSASVLIMYAVAAVLSVAGAGLLLALRRPSGPAKVYAFRMAGIMALSAGIVLACSATALWQGKLA